MSHKNKKAGRAGLGKAIIKDQNRSRRGGGRASADTWLHSSELDDGYEWGRLNLRSVTEESKLDEFLNTAKLAGTEFTAEKLNITVVDSSAHTGLPSVAEYDQIRRAQQEYQHYLSIPRRPKWDKSTTAEQLDLLERDSFLEWRRGLAKLEENEKLVLTPFERNLEFWRQLWRVIERSDVVVQIVDARNPLLFRSEDLEKYVKEINGDKVNMLLVSKADLLTPKQRESWRAYFEEHSPSLTVAFWSATLETERLKEEADPPSSPGSESESDDSISDSEAPSTPAIVMDTGVPKVEANSTESGPPIATAPVSPSDSSGGVVGGVVSEENPSTKLLTGQELIELIVSVSPVQAGELTTVGMVGYPNVGKSSTINALIQSKKVPVSATPGRTKHFQTLYLEDKLLLCDCPGLVFPTFVSTKAEMVCNGVLPIDQMRDHIPPVSLVCSRIPRPVLESAYGIRLPQPREGEDPARYPYAEELCGAYGYVRGFMTSHGQPDGPRSARYILKDYVNGRLLYCHPPTGIEAPVFNQHPNVKESNVEQVAGAKAPVKSEFDSEYFHQAGYNSRVVKKGVPGPMAQGEGKPWKKHNNRRKKEKTRRTQPTIVY